MATKDTVILRGQMIRNTMPTVLDDTKRYRQRQLAKVRWSIPWSVPKKNMAVWENKAFTRFNTSVALRKQGKEKIMRKLAMLPSSHIPGAGVMPKLLRDIIQPPQNFVELTGFNDEPVNSTFVGPVQPNVSRGFWGELSNAITQAGQFISSTEIAKYQAKTAEAQAKTAALTKSSKFGASTFLPSPFSGGGISQYLPWIIGLGGGALILTLIMTGKKRRK